MKRARDEVSAFAKTFEIISELTRDTCEKAVRMWEASQRHVASSSFSLSEIVTQMDTAVSLPVWMMRKVGFDAAFLSTHLQHIREHALFGENPPLIESIALVGNGGRSLVFSSSSSSSIEIPPALSEHFVAGDVVVVTQDPVKAAADSIRYVTFNADVFLDGDSWADGVNTNLNLVTEWAGSLLALPPGLAQLTFLMEDSLGVGKTGKCGWGRALQLPLLLQVKQSLAYELDRKVETKLKHCCLMLLRIFGNLLLHSESIMPLPNLFRYLLFEFLSSPLVVEGLSVYLPQLGENTSLSSMSAPFQNILHLYLSYCETDVRKCAPFTKELELNSINAMNVILHRLSSFWCREDAKTSSQNDVLTILDELGTSGLLYHAKQFVERTKIPAADDFFFKLQSYPTLKDLPEISLQVVRDQLQAAVRTYSPYVTKDTGRFLESLGWAAYAEFYENVSTTVKSIVEFLEKSPDFSPEMFDGVYSGRLDAVAPPLVTGQLSSLSHSELRHISKFGPAVRLTVQPHDANTSLHAHMSGFSMGDGSLSAFGFVLVSIQRTRTLFPVIVTAVNPSDNGGLECTAHILRDSDFFAESFELSVSSSGLHDCWLVMGNTTYGMAESGIKTVATTLPPFTPAISFFDFMSRLDELHRSVQAGIREGNRKVKKPHHLQGQSFLWMDYFTQEKVNKQVNVPTMDSAVSKAFFNNDVGRQCLEDISANYTFTAAQHEALHVLTSPIAQRKDRGELQTSMHVINGTVGSGRSTVLQTASFVKGTQLASVRKVLMQEVQRSIKNNGDVLKQLFLQLTESHTNGTDAADLMERIASSAEQQTELFVKLGTSLKYMETPFLLQSTAGEHSPEKEALDITSVRLSSLMGEGLARSYKSPLAQRLEACWSVLNRMGSGARDLLDKEGTTKCLWTLAAPFVMESRSIRETWETTVEVGEVSWSSYLQNRLWPSVTMVHHAPPAEDKTAEPYVQWPTEIPLTSSSFSAVPMPDSVHLPTLDAGMLAGWLSVFTKKQSEFLAHLCHRQRVWAQQMALWMSDLAGSVTAVSQTQKYQLIRSTPQEIFSHGLVRFFHNWRPNYVFLDDAEHVRDATLVVMSPANEITLAFCSPNPPFMKTRRHALNALFRGLSRELEKHGAVYTIAFTEPLRYKREELASALSQLSLESPFEAVAEEEGEEQPEIVSSVPLAGLTSCSSVEMWTHAVPIDYSAQADFIAARFLFRYMSSYEGTLAQPLTYSLVTGFEDEYRVWRETDGSLRPAVCCLPFSGTVSMHGETANDEFDIVFLSLSGLSLKLAQMGEGADWQSVVADSADNFLPRLQHWIWYASSRARIGIVLLVSVDCLRHVPLLRSIKSFVMKKRTQLAADANQAYWLPPATECAVAALRCPDHFKTKRTAKVEYDGENCVIGFEGATRCELMCLKLYEGCTTPSHVCLEKCHIQSREADDKHKCCPYPCRKTLPCGHGCHANCGDPCGPCGFTGLHKLKCGQRVISGITTDQVMQYTFFNHFQKSACGDAHRNCEEKVAHTCSRCGVKSLICCTVLTNLYCRAKQDANDTSTTETRAEPTEEAPPQGEPTDYGEMADFTLPENYCVGCVQLYNKVCSAFGYEAYPTPDLEKLTAIELGEEGEEEEVLAGASLPRHTLSNEAQAELNKLFLAASKKHQLRVKMEALQISNGRTDASSDYEKFKAAYEANKVQSESEDSNYKKELEKNLEKWTSKLRERIEEQTRIIEENETMFPLMVNNAKEEGARQANQ